MSKRHPGTTELQQRFDRERDRMVAEWIELLRFPSISTETEHEADCLACADWLVAHLQQAGFAARELETTSKPVVYAERPGRADLPTVLLYGHYDVQPVDPLDAWDSHPFDPSVRDGRIYARGAEDNKGQVFYALKALETLISGGALDLTVKVLIEGEEESGSQGISGALEDWRDIVAADVLLVTDTNTVRSGAPTIIMGLRGIVHLTVALSGPSHDLHSGVHGGLAPNPAQAMARLLAGLHDEHGRVAVDGFYDGVAAPSPLERELANAEPFDATGYAAATGVPPCGGERGFTPAERVGFRPSLDINGLHGGYAGSGVKTIIPARAEAKLTARTTPGQDGTACLQALVRHMEQHRPDGLRLDITEQGVGGPGFSLDPGSSLVKRARSVLDRLSDRPAVLMWEGASIPIVSGLAAVSGAEPLLCGFGSEEDRAHAPNESFGLDQFRAGYLYVASLLLNLQESEPPS